MATTLFQEKQEAICLEEVRALIYFEAGKITTPSEAEKGQIASSDTKAMTC